LAVADDFHPSDVDVHGIIVGNVHSRPWNRPYLYSTITREFLALPFVEEHHTSVKAINRSGVIVGAAQHRIVEALSPSHLARRDTSERKMRSNFLIERL
jgi:hypothetical protein